MKEPLDNVLAVLKDIVPVASELDTYYETNSYQADNYAKEQQLGPKYVQLYDQFYAAYNQLDSNSQTQHRKPTRTVERT